MDTFTRRLSVAATIGMFIVLLMGSTVTNTGSGEGCGRSWPLCHGEFIPEYAFSTLIEYSHRLVTSVEGLLLLVLSILAWRRRGGLPELTWLAPAMIVTLLLQSGMGAAAVMWPQSPAIMALHMGISLIAFASVFLTMRVLYEGADRTPRPLSGIPASYRWLTIGALLWSIVTTYAGAYLRHSGNEMACYTWPLCNGKLFPGFLGPEGLSFMHRLAALLVVVLLVVRWRQSRAFAAVRPDLARSDVLALALVGAQTLGGAFLVFSRISFASTMLHGALMALIFVTLADTVRRTLPQPAPKRRPASRVEGASATPRVASGD